MPVSFTSRLNTLQPSEPLAMQDNVVLEIGLQISDNLSLPWQDGVSLFKAVTTGAGTVVEAKFSEDLLMAPQGDSIVMQLQHQLRLSDQNVLADGNIKYSFSRTVAGGSQGVRLVDGDRIITLAETINTVLGLTLRLADTINDWQEDVFLNETPILRLALSDNLNQWQDS